MVANPFSHRLQPRNVFFLVCAEVWMLAVRVFVAGVIEERHRLVVIFVHEGVVWMRMALHAAHGCTLPDFPRCVDAVDDSGYPELFIVGSSLVVVHRVPMKS